MTTGMGVDLSADGKWALTVDNKDATLKVIPVGPGEAHALRWEGVRARWARWFPDRYHILLYADQSGQACSFVTDESGAVPKPIPVRDFTVDEAGIAADGDAIFHQRDRAWVLLSLKDGSTHPVPSIQPDEIPISWAEDRSHVFVESRDRLNMAVSIYKVDLSSGKRELWQVIKPSLTNFNVSVNRVAITPDGRRMVYAYRLNAGQLYISTNLR